MDTFRRHPHHGGFTLVEVMVMLLVMAFGILALAGMQLMLASHADLSKQRTEAMRLAQERMERLRAFSGISSGTVNWDHLSTAVETVTTNATFKVKPTLGGTTADPMRPLSVVVRWLDRTGTGSSVDEDGFAYNQAVRIDSVISKSDPSDSGFVSNPLPQNARTLRPYSRHLNIPVPGIDLGNGSTAYNPSPHLAIIYNSATAAVLTTCTSPVTSVAQQASAGCTTYDAFTVAGYVNGPVSTQVQGMDYAALVAGSSTTPSAVPAPGVRCAYGRAVDQNTGALLGVTEFFYICVVPVASLSTPGLVWSGTMRLGGIPTDRDFFVCRYQYNATQLSANQRNVQPYESVSETLDLQNYYVGSGEGSDRCPPSTADVTFVLHQDCHAMNPSRANECRVASPNGAL